MADEAVGRRPGDLEGKRGSKMSPPEGAEEGRALAEPYGGVIMILALGCSGDVWNILGALLEGEEIVSTRQFNR